MKVAHIIVGLEVGGAELAMHRLIEAHRQQRLSITHEVISLTTIGPVGARMQATGIPLTALGMRSPAQAPLAFFRLIKVLRTIKPDVVQTWMYHADLMGGVAAHIAGCHNVIWGIRTTDIAQGGSRITKVVRWLCARLSSRIPLRIVCAAEAARRLHAELGYCRDKLLVIPNGFDLRKLQSDPASAAALRRACGIGPSKFVVGTVGRFNSVKDQQNFVLAAGQIARNHGSVCFLMIGRGCDKGNEVLKDWLDATGYAHRFVLLGERSDVPVCLAAMDIFVLPSRTEGFPNVLAEAMAMRLPCVTTDVGDASLLLGGCGEVVPPGDSVALAAGVEKMLALSTDERAGNGLAARARVESEFSLARCARSFADLYQLTNPALRGTH